MNRRCEHNDMVTRPEATITWYDYRLDSFVSMPHYCANLKAIRYEPRTFGRIVADK